jgi:hypothetical protein
MADAPACTIKLQPKQWWHRLDLALQLLIYGTVVFDGVITDVREVK